MVEAKRLLVEACRLSKRYSRYDYPVVAGGLFIGVLCLGVGLWNRGTIQPGDPLFLALAGSAVVLLGVTCRFGWGYSRLALIRKQFERAVAGLEPCEYMDLAVTEEERGEVVAHLEREATGEGIVLKQFVRAKIYEVGYEKAMAMRPTFADLEIMEAVSNLEVEFLNLMFPFKSKWTFIAIYVGVFMLIPGIGFVVSMNMDPGVWQKVVRGISLFWMCSSGVTYNLLRRLRASKAMESRVEAFVETLSPEVLPFARSVGVNTGLMMVPDEVFQGIAL